MYIIHHSNGLQTKQSMTITPYDFEERVNQVLLSDSVVAFDLLEKLVQETVFLIEQHYPDLDIQEQKMNMIFLK
ncbi:hypothetical protein FIU87_12725 [Bacillus sp. THAF10]|nr:hypothetical protein [Bacillus sp. THAF10]QFT89516.1 hypothetical protein FIU87_12725 [Bacillus sp. THAF10]